MRPDLSIIIPTLNEGKRIGKTLDELAQYLRAHKQIVEVLVIDANSTDQTVSEAKKRAAKFKHFHVIQSGPKQGKGKQVRDGVFEAHGRYVMFMDADLATPLSHLQQVFALIADKKPVGICVRNLNESHTGFRKFISGFGNFLVQTILLPGIKDTQCGFKVFEADAAHEIFSRQRIVGWGFDMEVLAIARRLGYSIDLIEVPDWKDVAGGTFSGEGAAKAAIRTFEDLLNIRWGMLIGRYKKPSYHHKELQKA